MDKEFYDKQHKLNINGSIVIKNGNEIASPITVAENMYAENEKKREIFLLKPRYFRDFVEDFKKQNIYKKSGSYIQQRLKETN